MEHNQEETSGELVYQYPGKAAPQLLSGSQLYYGTREDIPLRDYLLLVLRYRFVIVVCGLLGLGIAAFTNYNRTPVYRTSSVVNIGSYIPALGGPMAKFLREESRQRTYVKTQSSLLKTNTIAAKVLGENQDILEYVRRQVSGERAEVSGDALIGDDSTDAATGLSEQSMATVTNTSSSESTVEGAVLARYLSMIDYENVYETTNVKISAEADSAEMAARIADAHAKAFIALVRSNRLRAATVNVRFLEDRAAKAGEKASRTERKLVDYALANNISVFTTDRLQSHNRYSQLKERLAEAALQRAQAEAEARETRAKTGLSASASNPALLSKFFDLATIESEIEELKRFNRADPAIKALKKESDVIRKTLKIHAEQQFRDADLRRKIHAEQERMLKQAIDRAAEEDLRKSQNATEYNLLERQFQAAKEAHKSISRRLEDAIVNAENDQKTVVLVDSAIIPSSPTSFARSTTLWNGALLGVFLGLGLSVILNLLDNRLRTTADVEASLHLPVLGVVPAFSMGKLENMSKTIATLGAPTGGATTHMVSAGSSMSQIESALEDGDISSLEGLAADMAATVESTAKGGDTVTVPKPNTTELFIQPSAEAGAAETEIIDKNIVLVSAPLSSESEAFRTVLTTLAYSGSGSEQKTPHTILISSGQQGDGKSTVATNLAVALGEVAGETLLIDADLRLPTVHKHFGQPRVTAGLADYLSGERDYNEVILHRAVGGLSVMFAGNPTVSPSLLFRSNAMSNLIELLKDEYDHIIIDGPPLIQVADALLLSKLADGVALVVRSGKTPRPVAQSALQQLKQVNANVVGTILNGVEVPRRSRNDEYYYYMSQVE